MYMGVTGCGDPPKVYVCLFVKISVWKRTFPHRGCFFGSSTVSHIITAIILFYSINRAVHQILFLLFLFFFILVWAFAFENEPRNLYLFLFFGYIHSLYFCWFTWFFTRAEWFKFIVAGNRIWCCGCCRGCLETSFLRYYHSGNVANFSIEAFFSFSPNDRVSLSSLLALSYLFITSCKVILFCWIWCTNGQLFSCHECDFNFQLQNLLYSSEHVQLHMCQYLDFSCRS